MEKSSFDREPMWKMNRPVDEPLSKRERFAMAAMQGMVSYKETEDLTPEILAGMAVEHADALLKELEETNED